MPRFTTEDLSAPDPWASEEDDGDQTNYRYDGAYKTGPQQAKIVWFDEHTARSGNRSYKVSWGIKPVDGSDTGVRIDQYVPLQGPRLTAWLKVVAPEILREDCEVPNSYFKGRHATVNVIGKESVYLGETRTRAEITDISAAKAATAPPPAQAETF